MKPRTKQQIENEKLHKAIQLFIKLNRNDL